jgi:APA family basic amino acid/polyamine antiporter
MSALPQQGGWNYQSSPRMIPPTPASSSPSSVPSPNTPSTKFINNLFRTKPVEEVLAEREQEGNSLKKCLNSFELTMFGLGLIIGAGIFVLTGVAARLRAGPAIIFSYAFSALVCIFSALCYAEFAARLPIAGSAYTYTYTTIGEFPAWIIGWDLILEYLLGASAIARGWSGYLRTLVTGLGIPLPEFLTHIGFWVFDLDMSAAFSVLVLTIVLCVGIKEHSLCGHRELESVFPVWGVWRVWGSSHHFLRIYRL